MTSIKRAGGSGKPSNSERNNTQSKWIINDGEDGEFDAVIVTVGTCGEPNMVKMKGMPDWKDEKRHKHGEEAEKDEKPQPNINGTAESPGDSPTQDNLNLSGNGVWDQNKPQTNEWELGRDQVNKKDQGFPKPDEAYGISEDVQKPVDDVAKEEVHKQIKGETSSPTAERKAIPRQADDQADDNDGDVFKGPIIHSSGLDHDDAPDFKGKTIVVIGSGASAVEAVETALAKGAKKTVVLARQDKVSNMLSVRF